MSYTLPPLFKETENGTEFHYFLFNCNEAFHDHGIMGKKDFIDRFSLWANPEEFDSWKELDAWLGKDWSDLIKKGWQPDKKLEEKLYARGAIPKL